MRVDKALSANLVGVYRLPSVADVGVLKEATLGGEMIVDLVILGAPCTELSRGLLKGWP